MTIGSFQPRPTIYAGIQMRSRLEADFAAWLDRKKFTWAYEPTCFAGPDGQWLPDFRIAAEGKPNTYVELKPMPEDDRPTAEFVDSLLRKMQTAWLSEPTSTLQLIFWKWGHGPEQILTSEGEYDTRTGLQYRAWTVTVDSGRYLWAGLDQPYRVLSFPSCDRSLTETRREFVALDRKAVEGWRRESALFALLEEHGDPELLRQALELVGEKRPDGEGHDLPTGVRTVRHGDAEKAKFEDWCAEHGYSLDENAVA